jgi:hypothetical protein
VTLVGGGSIPRRGTVIDMADIRSRPDSLGRGECSLALVLAHRPIIVGISSGIHCHRPVTMPEAGETGEAV